MCGIVVSLTNNKNFSESFQHVVNALDSQGFRGPDNTSVQSYPADSGKFIIFGHNRLSIIDLNASANQPIESPDGDLKLVFNGEIYNYKELASTYKLSDLSFQSDSWCLLELISLLGVSEAITKLRGMWSFVLYSSRNQKIYIHRDEAGIKPLFWTNSPSGLLIASDLRYLHKAFSSRINHQEVTSFLCGSEHSRESTYYENIRRFRPGFLYVLDTNGCIQSKSKVSSYSDSPLPRSFSDRVELYRSLFLQSIQRHLVADASSAIALSGGLDSSSIYSRFSLLLTVPLIPLQFNSLMRNMLK